MLRRIAVAVGVLICFCLACPMLIMAKDYPERGIEFVIPWPPGGPADIIGRIFANELGKNLKVPVTPVNKPGASATIGGTYVYKSKKDGYTLLCGTLGWLLGSVTLEEVIYDPVRDFIPIAKIGTSPHGIVVKADSPIRDLGELIDRAKKNHGALSIGTAGTSSDGHFNIEILQKAAGIKIKHVPFKGGGEIPPAILGGHVDAGIGVTNSWFPFVKAGSIRMLAITGEKRMNDLPDVATLKEKGFKENFLDNWVGFLAPAGVPKDVVKTLEQASGKILKNKGYVENVEKTASVVEFMTAADYAKMIQMHRNLAEGIAKDVGLKKK